MNTITTKNNSADETGRDKFYFRLVLVISIFVFATVILLNRKVLPRPEVMPSFTHFLPMINAFINATCSVLLLLSLYFIKRKNIAAHRTTNIITFLLSSVFLVLYILFHYFADETKFPAENPVRPFYLLILTSHILLAAAVLPLILLSFYYGLRKNVTRHKKIVRWTFPIWLYVTITGVVVYLMISPYYPF